MTATINTTTTTIQKAIGVSFRRQVADLRNNATSPNSDRGIASGRMRNDFSTRRVDLNREWEQKSGQRWPRFTRADIDAGTAPKHALPDMRHDTQQIRPIEHDGQNTWWNLTPLSRAGPTGSQRGVHRSGGFLNSLRDFFFIKGNRRVSEFQETLDWYKSLVFATGDPEASENWTAFTSVTEEDLVALKKKYSIKLPKEYEKFLLEVGEGIVLQGKNEEINDFDLNRFLGIDEIDEILSRKSELWNANSDLISRNEFPFFEKYTSRIYVFCLEDTDGAVWLPNKFKKIASSFEEFLNNIMEDANYYSGNELG